MRARSVTAATERGRHRFTHDASAVPLAHEERSQPTFGNVAFQPPEGPCSLLRQFDRKRAIVVAIDCVKRMLDRLVCELARSEFGAKGRTGYALSPAKSLDKTLGERRIVDETNTLEAVGLGFGVFWIDLTLDEAPDELGSRDVSASERGHADVLDARTMLRFGYRR